MEWSLLEGCDLKRVQKIQLWAGWRPTTVERRSRSLRAIVNVGKSDSWRIPRTVVMRELLECG
jgi:hypothetical protein